MDQAPLMLSVSGMRGVVGQSLTPVVAARDGAALGTWFASQLPAGADRQPHVVLGRDSRPSGQMLELAAAAGLIAAGCRVTTLGIVTTPSVAIMVEHLGADGGMVITASHNPILWNGIKPLRSDGVAPPPDQAAQIIARFQKDDAAYAPVEALVPLESNTTTDRVHIDRVLRNIDVQAIRRAKLKVVLDSVHGAGGPITALMMKELGVELVHLYAEPTGMFPHTPEPTKDNLMGLAVAVKEHKADLGFAQDPDADRLAIVDDRGVYIGEEYTLALAAEHVLRERFNVQRSTFKVRKPAAPSPVVPPAAGGETLNVEHGTLNDPRPVVVANLSTSRMVDDIAARFGATVVRTPVGEANVAAAMRQHQAIVGGEGNGGIIWPKVIHVRDSLSGIALILEMLAHRGGKLSALVAEIPAYAIVKDKTQLPPDDLPRVAQSIGPAMRRKFAQCKIDTQDGVRVDWPDRWVHVRTSNTEPIIRFIAEARDEATARSLIAEVRAAVMEDQ